MNVDSQIHDTEISAADILLMLQLGISRSYIQSLLGDISPLIADQVYSSDESVSSRLSPAEIEILRYGGAAGLGESNSVTRTELITIIQNLAKECRLLVDHCYDLAAVASRLQISVQEADYLDHHGALRLHSFRLGDGLKRFPCWQFTESGTIPGLSDLLSAVGDAVNPLTLSRFMGTKTADLADRAHYLCPRDWLIEGRDPELVFRMAGEL